MATVQS